jgi:ribosome-associated translation inhibitor RaiA
MTNMQIQVNTDNHIEGGAKLTQHVESVVDDALKRFGDRITRVEVVFTDENSSHKSGDDDMRCALEARLAGLQPIAVTHHAASLDQALSGAIDKMRKMLDRTLGKRDDPRGRTSYSGE